MEENMKKIFVLFLAMFLMSTMFTGCSQKGPEKEGLVSMNITIKSFHSPDKRQEYAQALDTSKYQILAEAYTHYARMSDTYDLVLIKKANNESYEIFEFSSEDLRTEFHQKIDSSKKIAYYEADGFYYLIVITENTAAKSTITIKEILQNEENYIVITDDASLVMVPKNISEFVTSSENNVVYLETIAGTITKATFCITEEMQKKIQ
jgi:hypothetical protein